MSTDQDFIASIELSTSSNKAVKTRFAKWRLTLESIIGIDQKEQRCFSKQLKKELFEKNQTCAICGQEIKEIDDSAVDHIAQYWQGGKTIPENARLTHRYCNWSRPRKDIINQKSSQGATFSHPSAPENEVADKTKKHHRTWEEAVEWTDDNAKGIIKEIVKEITSLGNITNKPSGEDMCCYDGHQNPVFLFVALLPRKSWLKARIRVDPLTLKDPQNVVLPKVYESSGFSKKEKDKKEALM